MQKKFTVYKEAAHKKETSIMQKLTTKGFTFKPFLSHSPLFLINYNKQGQVFFIKKFTHQQPKEY
jgi:hypothetical protein